MGWTRFLRRASWDRERSRELDSYVDLETDDNIAKGMDAASARAAALRKIGNRTLVREEIFHMNSVGLLETVWRDLRYGMRLLARNRGFAAVAVLSLALGIGANAAIFQLVDAVRLQMLPVSHPEELAEVGLSRVQSRETRSGRSGNFSGRRPMLSGPLWERISDRQEAFSGLAAWGANPFDLSSGGEMRIAQGFYVSGNFFDVFGVPPLIGRVFTERDDLPGCSALGAVLGYGFWQREYGGDPSAVGRTLLLDTRPFQVLGVAPEGFNGPEVGQTFDVAVPLCSKAVVDGNQGASSAMTWWLAAIGRLKPGWSIARASAQLAAISPPIFSETVDPALLPSVAVAYRALTLEAVPAATGVSSGIREDYETPLWILLGTTGLILLIACANIANLLLARAGVREREVAIRLAIGASRARVVGQLLVESALLAALGAAVGAGLGEVLSRGLVRLLRMDQPTMMSIDLDLHQNWHVWAFTTCVAACTCLLFGLVPALRATRTSPGAAMKAGGRGLTDQPSRLDLKRVLVVAQIALGLVLVTGALLFVSTFRNLTRADAGFRRDGVWDLTIDLLHAHVQPGQAAAFTHQLIERFAALPGVTSAAIAQTVPVSGSLSQGGVVLDGVTLPTNPYLDRVGPGYFSTLRTPILTGRDFAARDDATSRVAIVNESFAREYLNGENPIGHQLQRQVAPGQPQPSYEIVGLVKDTKHRDLREPFHPIVFFQYFQGRPSSNFEVVVRAAGTGGIAPALNRAIAEFNPGILVYTRTLESEVSDALIRERLMATLSGFFGVLAGLLATLGLYGVISYGVARRTNEIGIRMALGAARGNVLAMILREAVLLLAIGLAVGVALSTIASRAAASLLFGVQPGDPLSLSIAVLALAGVAIVASYIPARRAARLEPTVALRHE